MQKWRPAKELDQVEIVNYYPHVMNSLIANNLNAPGRMDVVEQVLITDPFFRDKVKESGRRSFINRRGITKKYSGLTIDLVNKLAVAGLDAVTMRRDEIIAKAFEFCELGEEVAA